MKKTVKKGIVVFIILALIILYARYVGTYGFITKEYTVNTSSIPNNFDGIKIVHFSDIHYNRAISISKIKSIVDEINLINPDIVVFTGDLIDEDSILSDKDYDKLINTLSKIQAKYGKYAVIGNHDYLKDKEHVINVLEASNFTYLENDYEIIYNNSGEKIFIGGLGTVSYNQDDLAKTMEYFNENDDITYRIILVHEPDISDEIVKNYDVDMILAGHSHNGQIRLPFIGALYTPKGAKKYYDNYYELDNTKLYISSGIGVSIVDCRLWNRPSINFYRIKKEITEWDFFFI